MSTRADAHRSLKGIQQQSSHACLSQDVSQSPSMRSVRGRFDAIIVPASRPASSLQPLIKLSAGLRTLLVVLCSKRTSADEVAAQVSRSGAMALVIEMPDIWAHPGIPNRTSDLAFKKANARRQSDLSAKRNLGLLLARLNGWTKIAFLDDDIMSVRKRAIARLAGQLEKHQVAGMVIRKFPDNSVVCHARRLGGFEQDVFVSGAVLGVRCNDRLSFFPDIYNEDWFFFAREAAARKLPSVGNARQAKFNPFINPNRARSEEFGDLLAEGLYALFGRHHPSTPFDELLDKATNSYWWSFMDARLKVINESHRTLYKLLNANPTDGYKSSALNSLAAAKSHLKSAINPQLCVNFLDAWREDLMYWRKLSGCISKLGGHREAMEFLKLKTWILVEFGRGVVDSETAPSISIVTGREAQPQPALEPSDSGQVLTLSS